MSCILVTQRNARDIFLRCEAVDGKRPLLHTYIYLHWLRKNLMMKNVNTCAGCVTANFFRIEIYIQFEFLRWSPTPSPSTPPSSSVRRSEHVFRHRRSVRWRTLSHLVPVYAKANCYVIQFMQFILSTRWNQPTCWVNAPSCFVNEQYCQQSEATCHCSWLMLRHSHCYVCSTGNIYTNLPPMEEVAHFNVSLRLLPTRHCVILSAHPGKWPFRVVKWMNKM